MSEQKKPEIRKLKLQEARTMEGTVPGTIKLLT